MSSTSLSGGNLVDGLPPVASWKVMPLLDEMTANCDMHDCHGPTVRSSCRLTCRVFLSTQGRISLFWVWWGSEFSYLRVLHVGCS